ncbi:hypothetical protein QR680_011895 [Steinernema hermaphroditum]|uniref:Uncharacterized protein n=1 Tax=Steinernema hermaphroditum TaxID=289476 RepID=A0AA39I1D1_9BILA|nr:hypothetical protein QR680_011895 [Steinernema hermaphroditum]
MPSVSLAQFENVFTSRPLRVEIRRINDSISRYHESLRIYRCSSPIRSNPVLSCGRAPLPLYQLLPLMLLYFLHFPDSEHPH